MGAEVFGYSLAPNTDMDNYVLTKLENKINSRIDDICKYDSLKEVVEIFEPEILFHLAAQPLVRESYNTPYETYQTNLVGTINMLECIRCSNSLKVGIFITTDKCYENKEQIWGYKESDSLGGYDPYSSSKACCEIAIKSWRNSFMNPKDYKIHGKSISSVRAGNVIGGGDWARDRIIPNCIDLLYLVRLDADDMYHKTYVDRLYKYEQNKETQVLISQNGYMYDSVNNRLRELYHECFTFFCFIYRLKKNVNRYSNIDITPYDILMNLPHFKALKYKYEILEGRNYLFNIHGDNTDSKYVKYNKPHIKTGNDIKTEDINNIVNDYF